MKLFFPHFCSVFLFLFAAAHSSAQRTQLRLATANDALLRNDLKAFYMPTSLTTRPPESGSYGFVRNSRDFGEAGSFYTRFHEGLDIRPLHRNASKIPTDVVRPIMNGTVAYVNSAASRSNYGKYVVVRHDWGFGPLHSLYAHLASTSVEVGQQVTGNTALGVIGSTGAGLNNARAHLHLELNIVMSERFNDWIKYELKSSNGHGNFNGINMAGMDLAGLFVKLKQDPNLNFAKWVHSTPQYFRVTVSRKGKGALPIVQRYRWMRFGNHDKPSASWEMAFSQSGFLIGVAPSDRKVDQPTVTYVRNSKVDHKHRTIGKLTGKGSSATLTASGKRFINLVTDNFNRG